MSDWELPFCLACDRQTEGDVYCSESCRVAEWERSCSSSGSTASSPQSPRASASWPTSRSTNRHFFLTPKYDFHHAQPYGQSSTPHLTRSHFSPYTSPSSYTSSRPILTPSSSVSSLEGLIAKEKVAEQVQLSDEDRRALREYERSFDQSRYARRQSTH